MREFINIIEGVEEDDFVHDIGSHAPEAISQWTSVVFARWLNKNGGLKAVQINYPGINQALAGMHGVDAVDHFIEFLNKYFGKWSYQRLVRVSAPAMLELYQKTLTPSQRSLKKKVSPDTKPSIEWDSETEMYINIGDFQAWVHFRPASMPIKGKYYAGFERGWAVEKTSRFQKTGLFPRINACLQIITEKFLREVGPRFIFIMGADAKRNIWNAKAYRHFDTPGYRFYLMIEEGDPRASPEGVIGVGWAKDDFPMPKNWEGSRISIEYV